MAKRFKCWADKVRRMEPMPKKRKKVCCKFCGRDTTYASGYCYQHEFRVPYIEKSNDDDEPKTTQEEYNGETVRDDI